MWGCILKAEAIEIDDPFAGEKELKMEALLSKISNFGQDLNVWSFEDVTNAYEPPIDTSSPN